MFEIFILILPSFIVIAVGGFIRGIRIADEKWVDILNRYGLWVGFPSLIFETLIRINRSDLAGKTDVFIANFAFLLGLFILTIVIMKLLKFSRVLINTFAICIFFGNVSYLGYPVVMSVFPERESELSIIISIYVMVLFTLGIGWLEYSKNRKLNLYRLLIKFITNPFIIAIVLGLIFIFFDIKTPVYIKRALEIMKASASPVVLIALGIFIFRRIDLKKVAVPVISLSILKLVVVPLIYITILYFFGDMDRFNVSVIESAMPLAITPFALSSIYDLDREIIGNSIVLSTLISMVTLPMFINLTKIL